MDDILGKIQDVLSDEESMAQIKKLADMLGLDENTPPPDFLNFGGNDNNRQENASNSGNFDFDISKIMALKEIINKANQRDTSIDLIIALRPLLKEETQKKADKIIGILKVMNMVPLLKDSGILGGDLLGIL